MRKRREKWREIIFEAETPEGKAFDVVLLVFISLSVLAVLLESVRSVRETMGTWLYVLEWVFTAFFTVEYVARLWVSRKPMSYAKSFYGVVDLLSILPSYLGLLVSGGHVLMVVRVLRLLRVFRVLKMVRHVNGAEHLMRALIASRAKITVFFMVLTTISLISGTIMYLIEGEAGGFSSIPVGIYWAVVTITTLGYGDVTPTTAGGQVLTAFLALTGYAIIAVPTGIVTAELSRTDGNEGSEACPSCGVHGHLPDAKFCRRCGAPIE